MYLLKQSDLNKTKIKIYKDLNNIATKVIYIAIKIMQRLK